jgi:hypothetical protein
MWLRITQTDPTPSRACIRVAPGVRACAFGRLAGPPRMRDGIRVVPGGAQGRAAP